MKSADNPDRKIYQLIITRRNASEILFLQNDSGLSLPSVEIVPRQRLAPQLTAEVSSRWGLEAYCLFLPTIGTFDPNARELNSALLESPGPLDRAPLGTCWLATNETIREGEDESGTIRQALEQLDSYVSEAGRGPFARPGWFGELLEWIQGQILPLGLRVTANFRQVNSSPSSSLMRLETNGPAVWFKATQGQNRHELGVSVALARLFPAWVPAVWGVHSFWNGWISPEASGRELEEFTEVSVWEKVAEDLAHLQIASIGKHTELLQSGCKDLRFPRLREQIDPFLTRMAELMAAQPRQPPRALTNEDLSLLRDSLNDAFAALEDVGMPDTVGHMDFNPGNIFISPERTVFLDWAECAVTNPLVTQEYLLEHYRRQCPENRMDIDRIRAAYYRPWETRFSAAYLAEQASLASLVALFACAVNTWRSRNDFDQACAGYLRSLTRRMFREGRENLERSGRCLA